METGRLASLETSKALPARISLHKHKLKRKGDGTSTIPQQLHSASVLSSPVLLQDVQGRISAPNPDDGIRKSKFCE